jgi:phage-related protein
MAEYTEVIDNAGRTIKVALDTLGTTIKDGMSAAMAETEKFATRDDERNATLENIKSLMEQLGQSVSGNVEGVQQAIDMHTKRQQGAPSDDTPRDKPALQEQFTTVIDAGMGVSSPDMPATEAVNEKMGINMHGEKMSTWLDNGARVNVDSMPETIAQQQAGENIVMGQIPIPPQEPPAGAAGEGGSGGKGGGKGGGGLNATAQKTLMRQIARISTGLLGVLSAATGGISVSTIFEGAIKEELDYHKIMSRLAYQTHGLSDASSQVRDNFRSAGDRLQTVHQTGQKIGKWMKGMVKMQERGLKNAKFNDKLIKSALNMSTMTGIEAETATEMYGDWAQHFGMSNFELASMNVAMKDIARQTGLTGENLAKAVKASEGLTRKMRGAGTATQETVAMMAKLSALAQAEGIADVYGEYAEALSGGFANFQKLPNNIKSSVMRFAELSGETGAALDKLQEEIFAGRGGTAENMAKIAQGMIKDTNARFGSFVPEGQDFHTMDLNDVSATDLKAMQLISENIYGKSVEDMQKMVKINVDAGKDLNARIGDAFGEFEEEKLALKDQLAKGIIDEGQYNKLLADREAQFDTLKGDLEFGEQFKGLNDILGKAGEQTGSEFMEAIQKAGPEKVVGDFSNVASTLETKLQTALEAGKIDKAKFDSIMGGNTAASLTSDLEAALAGGDKDKAAALQEELIKLQQSADTVGITTTNVVDDIEQHVNEINAYLRNIFSDGLIGILEKVGAVAVIVMMMGASIVTALAGLGVVLTTILGPARMMAIGSGIGARLAKPLAGIKGLIKGGKGGGRVAGMAVTRKGLGNAASRAKGVARGRIQMLTGASEFKHATKGMRTSVGAFGKSVKETVKNSKVWTKSSQLIDGAGRTIAKGVAASKKKLARPMAKAIGRSRTAGRFVRGKVTTAMDNVGQVAARGVKAVKGSKVGLKVAATSAKVGKGLANTSRVLNGMGKAGITAARGLGTTLKAVGSWTVVLPIAISAIEGFAGAMMAGAKAHEIFDVAQGEVTERQRMAAEGAGIFTGVLDGLTFGLFNKWLGPVGSVTVALSKFMHTFWPLALVLQGVLLPFKILWGVLKGLWFFLKNAFIGLWEGLKMAVQPVIDIFEILWDAVSEIGSVFTDLFDSLGIFGDTGSGLPSIVDVISGALGMLGTALGWVFKAIGFVIKMALTPLVWAIKYLVKPIVWLIKTALTPVIWAIKVVAKAFIWLYDAMVKPVINMVKGIFKWFNDLYMWLVGGSLIPDMIMGIFKWFLKLPGLIFKAIWKIPSMIITALLSIPKMLYSWASDMFAALGLDGLADFFGGAADAFGGIIDIVKGIFSLDFGMVWDGIKGLGSAIWGMISSIPAMLWDVLVGIPGMIWDTLKGIPGMIWDGLTALPGMLFDAITNALKGLVDWVLGFIPGGKEAVKGFSETAEEQSETWKEEGASVGHGVGGVVGGVKEVLSGNILEGGGKIIKGGAEAVVGAGKAAVSAVTSVVSGVGSALGSLFGYDKGTQKIERSGLAMLHAGEVIVPADAVTAGDNGKSFEGGGGIMEMFGLGGLADAGGGIMDSIMGMFGFGDKDKGVGEGVGGGIGKVMDTFNPLSWFSDGPGPMESIGKTIGGWFDSTPAGGMLDGLVDGASDWLGGLFGGGDKKEKALEKETAMGGLKESEAARKTAMNELMHVAEVAFDDPTKSNDEKEAIWSAAKAAIDSGDTGMMTKMTGDMMGGLKESEVARKTAMNELMHVAEVAFDDPTKSNDEKEAIWSAAKAAIDSGDTGMMTKMTGDMMGGFKESEAATKTAMNDLVKVAEDALADPTKSNDEKEAISAAAWAAIDSGDTGMMTKMTGDITAMTSDTTGGVEQGSDESNRMKEFYADLATSNKDIASINQQILDYLTKGSQAGIAVGGETKKEGGFFSTLFGGLKERVGGVIDAIKDSPVGKAVSRMVDTVKESPVGKAVSKMIDVVKESPMGKAAGAIGGGVMDAASWFGDKAMGTGDQFADWFGFGEKEAESGLGTMDMLNPFNWFGNEGEVTVPDKSTGETRTMSAEESAEARLTRHKVGGQPQQVMTHGTDTASLEAVGLDQLSVLSQIRDGINKLSSAFDVSGPAPTQRIGGGGDPGVGDTTTRYTGNSAALDFGHSPYSAGNEPGMQQVVSQGGVGE